jgi:hypothetical protein
MHAIITMIEVSPNAIATRWNASARLAIRARPRPASQRGAPSTTVAVGTGSGIRRDSIRSMSTNTAATPSAAAPTTSSRVDIARSYRPPA